MDNFRKFQSSLFSPSSLKLYQDSDLEYGLTIPAGQILAKSQGIFFLQFLPFPLRIELQLVFADLQAAAPFNSSD